MDDPEPDEPEDDDDFLGGYSWEEYIYFWEEKSPPPDPLPEPPVDPGEPPF